MSGIRLLQLYGNRRMACLVGLGFAAGLPLMLVTRTLTVWARDKGIDLTTIGLFGLVTLPYTLKFLWAPVMDRFVPPFLGRRRGWIVISQIGLILAILGMAAFGPRHATDSLKMFALMSVAVSFMGASLDIVSDAYRTDVLTKDEFGPGASVYVTGYRVAMLASGAGAVFVADRVEWIVVYSLAATGVTIGLIAAIFAPEPESSRHPPLTLTDAIVEPFVDFIKRNSWRALIILLFIVVFKLPDYMAQRMTDPLLLDIGFSKSQIAIWALGVGIAVTIPGALAGGLMIARIGLIWSLLVFGVAQAVSNLGYLILAQTGYNYALMIVVVGIEYFCMGLVVAGFIAFLMSQCNKRYSATQYALLSSVMGLSNAIAGPPSGYMAEHLGYESFFIITILVAIPGLLLLLWLPRRETVR